jgi:SAM-dependent methyltransferase
MKNRQAIADAALRHTNPLQRPAALLRYAARKIAYSPLVRGMLEKPSPPADTAALQWDKAMSQSSVSTYLGNTITVDSSNAMTATLIAYHAPQRPAVLDVGCGAGTLVRSLSSYSKYIGTDISPFAIETGKAELADYPNVELLAADIRAFTPPDAVDAVVLNEVLYYLNSNEALQQVARYSRFLSKDGIVFIAMKHDPKSATIFSLLKTRFNWVDGMLWQRKAFSADYSVRINREQPAFLLGVFKQLAS